MMIHLRCVARSVSVILLMKRSTSGLEHQVARHDMGVKLVFSVAVFLEGISYPAFGIAKLSATDVSELHGEIHVGVVFRTSYLDSQIAASELKVLVSHNVLYREVAATHAGIYVCRCGNFDRDLQLFFGHV